MKKETTKKVSTPKLVSYTMTAIIPTGQYQNIQPSIVVQAETLEQAQAYVMPHIESLYKQYFNINEKTMTAPKSVEVQKSTVVKVQKLEEEPNETVKVEKEKTVSFANAEKAISSCYSFSALELIEKKIDSSEKLTKEEKTDLNFIIMAKHKEIGDKNR